MGSKNILIIHSTLNGGGAEKVLIDYLRNFNYTDYNVELLLLRPIGVYLNQIPHQVMVTSVYQPKLPLWEKLLFRLPHLYQRWQKRKTNKALGDRRYDAIISFMEGAPAKHHSYILNRSNKHLSFVHCNLYTNYYIKKSFRQPDAEKFYATIDDIIFVSKGCIDGFEKRYKVDTPKHIIYNFIDIEKITESAKEDISINKSKFTIINVGRLINEKRQDRIIKIAKILKDKNIDAEFWILGEGPLEQQLKAMANSLEIGPMIKFLGFQSNPYKYMAKADVFLLTSQSEGFALVVLEALALGKPAICTRISGPYEIINDGSGILCDEDNTKLSDAIISLINDKKLYADYAEKAKTRIHHFTPQNSLSQLYALLG